MGLQEKQSNLDTGFGSDTDTDYSDSDLNCKAFLVADRSQGQEAFRVRKMQGFDTQSKDNTLAQGLESRDMGGQRSFHLDSYMRIHSRHQWAQSL